VIEKPAEKPPTGGTGLRLTDEKKLGAAQLLLKAADEENVSRPRATPQAVTNLAAAHPGFLIWAAPNRT